MAKEMVDSAQKLIEKDLGKEMKVSIKTKIENRETAFGKGAGIMYDRYK